jgi:uncharacterized protein
MPLTLKTLTPQFAVCQLDPVAPIPEWASQGEFFSISRTTDELSVVCETDLVPENIKSEPDWRGLKVLGPLDFSLVGILAELAAVLAVAGVSIFAISTYDTDYLLVKANQFDAAIGALRQAGHTVG